VYPLATAQTGPLKIGMSVLARNIINFGDIVIEQGTKGEILFIEEDSFLVKWDGIGDRPAAPSQLVPVDADASPSDDDEEVFYPKSKRRVAPQAVEKAEEEDVEEEPVVSLARMEENKAREEARAKKSQARTQENRAKQGTANEDTRTESEQSATGNDAAEIDVTV